MVSEYFDAMHTGGDGRSPSRPMHVHLYPWSMDETSAVQSDGVVTNAIKDVAEQLLDNYAIDYYAIYRWKYEHSDTKLPEWGDIDNCTMGEIEDNFRAFVKNSPSEQGDCGNVDDNGTGENHYYRTGVHQLIHGGSTGCNETAGNYAPAGAGAEKWGETAFNEGRVAWSPVCSSTSLTQAAAAQETLHMFMHPDWDGTNPDDHDCGDVDLRQHSLGTLNWYYNYDIDECTPMLAYHWDDFDNDREDPYCLCPVDREADADTHTTELTSCTIEAVDNTADHMT